ncbi:hypothetical protein [Bradyrhizobium sp. sBnM-33]|uniref:hypothetical protein n=1 Tax=Bradyrhizobium sp. sBnM-33 TaxID=2831780 RepID=UPI001BD1B5D8|nr:hypothetical protein [Bradyrhizobium sp. sBnM-33]WOH53526.1 hypothetical protein RX328_16400 [Bradyrhizobium sp. sBnM-33]
MAPELVVQAKPPEKDLDFTVAFHPAGQDRRHAGVEPRPCPRVYRAREKASLGAPEAEERPMKTVWIYVDTSKLVGDRDHLKVFANSDLADEWFLVNHPEGVVFEYEVIGAVDDETG